MYMHCQVGPWALRRVVLPGNYRLQIITKNDAFLIHHFVYSEPLKKLGLLLNFK